MKNYIVSIEFKSYDITVKAKSSAEAKEKALWKLWKKTQNQNSKGWPKRLSAILDHKKSSVEKI